MRPRVVYVLTWAVATAAATGIGFVATTTVGDVLRGTGPLGPDFRAAPPFASEVAEASVFPLVATFTFEQGTLTARCTGSTAQLVDVRPAPGWTLTDSEPGPDEDIDVDLAGAGSGYVVHIEVYCNEGEPRPVVTGQTAAPPR